MSVTPNGSLIRRIRRAQNLSLRDLASLTGLDRGHLSRVERGEAGASAATIRRIAAALGVPPADITSRGDDTVPTQTEQAQEAPHPASVEGSIYLYPPVIAAKFLDMSPIQLKRSWYARQIPFTKSKRGHRMTGRQICEQIAASEVRPIAETRHVPKQRGQRAA